MQNKQYLKKKTQKKNNQTNNQTRIQIETRFLVESSNLDLFINSICLNCSKYIFIARNPFFSDLSAKSQFRSIIAYKMSNATQFYFVF